MSRFPDLDQGELSLSLHVHEIMKEKSICQASFLGGYMKQKSALVLMFTIPLVMSAGEKRVNTVQKTASAKQVFRQPDFGPVCYPGDPCGPQSHLLPATLNAFIGPVCFPGDPCGSKPGTIYRPALFGPVCFPGDPCGSRPGGIVLGQAETTLDSF
jgi:hypothetical protein